MPRYARVLTILLALATTVLAAPPAASAAAGATPVPAPDVTPLAQWSQGCPAAGGAPAPARRLVVHHTHEPVAHHPDDVPAVLNQICRGHRQRGFQTVGYHYLIDPWGRVWQGRGVLPGGDVARQPVGAHAQGFNTGSVGIALIGDFSTQPPSEAALDTAAALMAWLADGAGLDPSAGTVMTSSGGETTRQPAGTSVHLDVVGGHRDTSHTDCPGEHLYALLDDLRADVAGRIDAARRPAPAPVAVGPNEVAPERLERMRGKLEVRPPTAGSPVMLPERGDGTVSSIAPSWPTGSLFDPLTPATSPRGGRVSLLDVIAVLTELAAAQEGVAGR